MTGSVQFQKIALRIIKKQESIIGPLAWIKAGKVSGLNINQSKSSVTFIGDERDIISSLVAQYVKLFGRVAYEVCKESAQDLLAQMPEDQIPSIFGKTLKFSENPKIPEQLYRQSHEIVMKLEKTRENLRLEKMIHKETGEVIKKIEKELKK